jgi:type II secretory pathway component PulJ
MVEVLLAISIFSMVMVAIYACWSAILRGSRSGLAAAAEVQRARVTIHALEESLGSALLYADNARYYSFFADTSSQFSYLSFVARLPQSFPGSGLFPGKDLRRVTFEVSPEGMLLLRQSPILEATEIIGEPYTIKLAPAVTTFAMEFFDTQMNDWVPEWIYTNQLPRMMRLALGFGTNTAASAERITMRTIPLNSVAISRVGAMTGAGGNPGAGGVPNPQATGERGDRRERGSTDQRDGRRNNQQNSGFGGNRPFGSGGADQGWRPNLPNNFGANRGNVDRNSRFPPSSGGGGGGGGRQRGR